MSELTSYLIDILEEQDFRHQEGSLERYFFKTLERKPEIFGYAQECYEELDGKGDLSQIRARDFDIELPKVGIYIDGALDFNKYRSRTLRSDAYDKVKHLETPNLQRMCRQYESECLKSGIAGNLWHNKEAEKHFGISEEPGDLGLHGSAAWKLRAFENYLGDLRPLISPVSVLRISLYDNLVIGGQLTSLKSLLQKRISTNKEVIGKYLRRKATGAMMKYL